MADQEKIETSRPTDETRSRIETSGDRNDAQQTEYRSLADWATPAAVLAVGYKDELKAEAKKIADKISGNDDTKKN